MEKNIYLYLSVFVILYGLYRINSSEHFENNENVKIYIKSKYNLQDEIRKNEEDKIKAYKIKENQIRQFELGKAQIIKAQNEEILIKQSQVNSKLEELRLKEEEIKRHEINKLDEIRRHEDIRRQDEIIRQEDIRRQDEIIRQEEIRRQEEIKKQVEINRQEEIKSKVIKEQLVNNSIKINKKGFIQKWNDKITTNVRETIKTALNIDSEYPTITYVERFNQIKEYMTSTLFNTAKVCGFSYVLIQPSSNNNTPSSSNKTESIPPLKQGEMYLTNNKSQIILHYADKSGNTGLNIPLSSSNLFITDGVSKYQIGISNFNSNLDLTGYFTINVNLSGIPPTFFNSYTPYILYDCSLAENTVNIVMENNLYISFGVFIGLVVFTILIINYELVLQYLNYAKNFIYPIQSQDKIAGGKNTFYVGGYDYRDYSD